MTEGDRSLSLEELDVDGALRETLFKVAPISRSQFLKRTFVGGSALIAAVALPDVEASASDDIAILNFALTLEYLQADFYTEAERIGALGRDLAVIPRQLGAVERAHVAALKKAIGKSAVSRPTFDFRGTTEEAQRFLKTAVAFEDLGVAAYKGQAPRLKSRALLASAISIHSVEARHAAWIRYLAGFTPASGALDEPLSGKRVKKIVASTRFVGAAPKTTKKKASPRFAG